MLPGVCPRLDVLATPRSAPMRSSAARAALRGARPLPHLFRARFACAFRARTPWRMAGNRRRAKAYPSISNGANRGARQWIKIDWPETDVGAALRREAPRGRRSIYPAPQMLRRTVGRLNYSLVALLLRRGIPRRWRRSHRHLRLTPSLRASSVSVMWSWCSSTKCWK